MALDLPGDTLRMMGDFGEEIIYRPLRGRARTISAIVDREDMSESPQLGNSTPLLTITVANDATDGIVSSEIDCGGDKIDVALRIGLAKSTRQILRIVGHDAGEVTFEVR